MSITEEKSLIAFRAICNFVNDLAEEYGKRHKPLLLYKRLANHTQIAHDRAIKKHISIFTEFCTNNREALVTQDSSKLSSKRLDYSDRVYIDMDFIFRIADSETSPVIWQHLLTISALLDPSGKAKDILRKQAEDSKNGGDEAKFINDLILKLEEHVKPDATPMEVILNIMKSGTANELVTGIKGGLKSGKLDLKKILGAVQSSVSTFENKDGVDPETSKTLGMLNSVLGSLSGDGEPLDMGMLLQMAMSTMGGENSSMPNSTDILSMMQTFGPLLQTMSSQSSAETPSIEGPK